MSLAPKDPLLLAGRVVVIIGQALMIFVSAVCALIIAGMLIFQSTIAAEFATEFPEVAGGVPQWSIIGLMVFGIIFGAIGWFFLRHMRRIIDTVGQGDPFVPENAERLTAMGWLALAVQLVSIPAAGLGRYFANALGEYGSDVDVDVGIDGYAVVLIITLFILARVFRHGTAMRDDLEGTV